ncbi:acyclic terpene utilization AtuA family protein [Orbus sturtevantii]|uniref:acyclic terpene utilization AtuA family protein n=1 Tax=Orbus sturtevantii TaxID=3074109 RepID=UPI00370DC04E
MKKVRIGCGAGYGGDRIEPAIELAQEGDIDYLIFECLAERTIAIGQRQKKQNSQLGFNEFLAARMEAVLPICAEKKIKIITNMGSANPRAAADLTCEIAKNLGLSNLKIAIIEGDNVYDTVIKQDLKLDEAGTLISKSGKDIISANAYLGAAPLVEALQNGADIIIAGRVADPSLFLAAMMFEFDWQDNDWDKLGKGTAIGHLLECAGQITGGYFADPGYRDVPNLARLGFPIAEVTEDGNAVITKVADAGGCVTIDTCKQQLLYEIHKPDAYITPDVVADFTGIKFKEVAKNCIAVSGARGKQRTETLKVSVGYCDGFIGEGEMSYAGPGAVQRGRLALDIVKERLSICHIKPEEVRFDLIGINSLHGERLSKNVEPYEVRARVAARFIDKNEAAFIGNEVETLYTNGPAGGGGAFKSVKEIIAMDSTLLERNLVKVNVSYLEV